MRQSFSQRSRASVVKEREREIEKNISKAAQSFFWSRSAARVSRETTDKSFRAIARLYRERTRASSVGAIVKLSLGSLGHKLCARRGVFTTCQGSSSETTLLSKPYRKVARGNKSFWDARQSAYFLNRITELHSVPTRVSRTYPRGYMRAMIRRAMMTLRPR